MLCIDATLRYVAIQIREVTLQRAEFAHFRRRMLATGQSGFPWRYFGDASTPT